MYIFPPRLKSIIRSGPPRIFDADRYQLFLTRTQLLLGCSGVEGFRAAVEPEWPALWNWLRAGLEILHVYELNHDDLLPVALRNAVISFVVPILSVLSEIVTGFNSDHTATILETHELKELLALCIVVAFTEPDNLTPDDEKYQHYVLFIVQGFIGMNKCSLTEFVKALELASRSVVGTSLTDTWKNCLELQFIHPTYTSISGHRLYLFLLVITLPGNEIRSRLDVAQSAWPYVYRFLFLEVLHTAHPSCDFSALAEFCSAIVSHRAQRSLTKAPSRGLFLGNTLTEVSLQAAWGRAVDIFCAPAMIAFQKSMWALACANACSQTPRLDLQPAAVPAVESLHTVLKRAKLPIIEMVIGQNAENLRGSEMDNSEHPIHSDAISECSDIPSLEKHYLYLVVIRRLQQLSSQICTLIDGNSGTSAVVVNFSDPSADTMTLLPKHEVLEQLCPQHQCFIERNNGLNLSCGRISLDLETSMLIPHLM
ncbi:hypothetical protein F5050DRAFT_1715173 [Lentinula boryana]|uniref:Uncharacterized protein n=1 Tax=Lentinula boryana TaxID=40481 RepID=A0ABQ8Q1Q7_9AGAR|nr:hypothetical protein F5050DRAFT_1715173 [Lentinula boryana]